METNCTVINCDYRLAPEDPAPAGIHDAYSIILDICQNADKYCIDANHVAVFGESGGAYILAGACMMLAENKQSHLLRFQLQQIPMIDNFLTLPNIDPPMKPEEAAA